MDWPCCT